MPQIYHQTVRLGKGKHSSPTEGVCVMELASLLAGEPFTDYPRSVSPVLASFLRMYNDRVDNRRRQDLYAVAASVVGTRAGAAVEELRAKRLLAWSRALPRAARPRALSRMVKFGPLRTRLPMTAHEVACFAIHAIGRVNDEGHAATLDVVAELAALTKSTTPGPFGDTRARAENPRKHVGTPAGRDR